MNGHLTLTHIAVAIWCLAGVITIACLIAWGRELSQRAATEANNAANYPWQTDHSHIPATPIADTWEHARIAARMDRIRHDIAVRQFADDLRDWDGSDAA